MLGLYTIMVCLFNNIIVASTYDDISGMQMVVWL